MYGTIRGYIKGYQRTADTWQLCTDTPNQIVYSGYDLAVKALAGISGAVINGMYIEYTNVGSPTEPVIPADRTAAYYNALSGNNGYVRLTALNAPTLTATGVAYTSNKAIFTGVTSDTSEHHGASIVDGTTKFISLALVCVVDINDRTKDIIFSAASLKKGGVFTPQTKIAGSGLAFSWDIVQEAGS